MPTNQATKVLSDREFAITHEFEAPAAKIFAAYTEPKHIVQWWAPKGGSIRVDRLDLRPGGAWRFVQRAADGQESVFHGSYLEVKPVTRLVYTFEIEGQPQKVTATIELRETAGKTHMTLTNLCETKERRDTMVKYGAVPGARMAMQNLAEYLRTV